MKQKLLSLLLTLSLTLGLAAPALAAEPLDGWTDLEAGAWYAEAVSYVIDNGLMGSTSTEANVFNPGGTVTRAEVYQIIYNMEGRPQEGLPVLLPSEDAWYAPAIRWAAAKDIYLFNIKLSTDSFDYPNLEITRAYVAAILADYAKLKGVAADPSAGEASGLDDLDTDLQDGIQFCYRAGIMTGDEQGNLNPYGKLTRAELAQVVMNLSKLVSGASAETAYTEETVSIEVPETDGIPAHTVPAIVTIPAGEGPFPAVVMLHGTGTDKHEAGNGYDMAAAAMAEAGIATIRIDFMGNGDSTASYTDYCFTSANLDAKAAADYMAGLDAVDGDKIGIQGWSQGGTNALLAAAAYPETFKAVVTWAGSVTDRSGAEFEAQYEAAKENGYYVAEYDWREPQHIGLRWYEENISYRKLDEVAKIEAPILAIQGMDDTSVLPENADMIVEAAQNENTHAYFIEDCDHTFNIFTGDVTGPLSDRH